MRLCTPDMSQTKLHIREYRDMEKIISGITEDMLIATNGFENLDADDIDCFRKKYRANIDQMIPNIYLVLDKKRLAYRMDVAIFNEKLHKYLCQAIVENIPELAVIEFVVLTEPFICLKSRIGEIDQILEQKESHDRAMGLILGYEYVCDLVSLPEKTKTFVDYISEKENRETFIYGFAIPDNVLNDEFRSKIEAKAKDFELTLCKYGFHVRSHIWSI
jgi:hypothetical protein